MQKTSRSEEGVLTYDLTGVDPVTAESVIDNLDTSLNVPVNGRIPGSFDLFEIYSHEMSRIHRDLASIASKKR